MQPSRFTSSQAALSFMLAGNATITLRSKKTGSRFTYRIRKSDDGFLHFVQVLTGSDNESSYRYLGLIRRGCYEHGQKSKIGADADSNKAFAWSFGWLATGKLPERLEIWHEGKCGRCGRKLTVPESIERGIGPDCASFICEAA